MSTGKPDRPIVSTTALARHLGLSRWTISRVINGHSGVSEETARRVREAMQELDFVPNVMARGLRGGRTGLIGVSFQGFDIPIFVQKMAALQDALRRIEYRALIELTDREPELERDVIRHLSSIKVEGLILVGGLTASGLDDVAAFLGARNLPTVAIDPGVPVPFPTVQVDRGAGIKLLFDHLRDLGHTRFCLLGLDPAVPYGRSRWEGVEQVAETMGITTDRLATVIADPAYGSGAMDFDYGHHLAGRVLELRKRPTAVLALNDRVAFGAVARLREAGLKVPRDISVVGFDNLEMAAQFSPGLTTVDQEVSRLMQAGVDALVRQLDGSAESDPAVLQVRPRLVVRGSTAPPPRN